MKKALKFFGAAAVTAVLLFSFVGCDMFTDDEVSVSSIILDSCLASIDTNANTTFTATATVLPSDADDKSVIWSTSDETVATVDSGVVSAVGSGTARITAKAGSKSAVINVHVNDELELTGTWYHADASWPEKWVVTDTTLEKHSSLASTTPDYSFTIIDYDNSGFNAGDTDSSDCGYAVVKYDTPPSYNDDADGYVIYRWKNLTTSNGEVQVDISEGFNSSYSDGAPTASEAVTNYNDSTASFYGFTESCIKQ